MCPEVLSVLRTLEGLLSPWFLFPVPPNSSWKRQPSLRAGPVQTEPTHTHCTLPLQHFQPVMHSSYEAFDSVPVDWIRGDFFFYYKILAFRQKRRHIVYIIETKLPSCEEGLPLITTFHTRGGVAFDLKSLWQFTSELLSIRSAGPVKLMHRLNSSCVKKTKHLWDWGYRGRERIKRMCTFLPENFRVPRTWSNVPLSTHCVKT